VDDIGVRILNPGVVFTMVLAGLAYGRLLWAVNLRPNASLWILSTGPGAIYLLTVWMVRAVQGTPSLIWPALLLDWLVFATTGFLSVLVMRWWRVRR